MAAMNSALKPLTTASQNSGVSPQLGKNMHPQGGPTPATYGQPSHIPQSLVNMHPNTNAAHNHPSSQQHHYSLPTATTHYMSSGGQIPASNHPVANPSASAAGQMYNPQKNVGYLGGYQPNLGHPPNQNAIPPVSQTLPATGSPQSTPTNTQQQQSENIADKPQSNGTQETKSPQKSETPVNNVTPVKEKTPQPSPQNQISPAQVPQISAVTAQKSPEIPKTSNVPQENKCSDPVKAPETPESEAAVPTPPLSNAESDSSSPKTDAPSTPLGQDEKSVEEKKDDEDEEENEKNNSQVAQENGSTTSEVSKEEKDVESDEKKDTENEIVEENEKNSSMKKEQSPTKKDQSPPKPVTTPRTPNRKSKTPKLEESPRTSKEKTPVQKSPSTSKGKRQRMRTQHYQSPLPELEIITKITAGTPRNRNTDEKLIVFYKNEFLAVRNAEGGFYLCQAVQNIYKSSSKIKIRWLSQDKNDKTGEIYAPDFYDLTDFDCILTNLSLNKIDKGKFRLPPAEKERTESILNRSLAVEKGEVTSPSLTEEHPDGLDLSLYKDEDQIKKRRRKASKRKASKSPSKNSTTPTKKSPETPKARKVAKPPAKKLVRKTTAPKTTVSAAAKKTVAPASKKPVVSGVKSVRGKRKIETKTSPVVDQKKAKVLAKIGRKTAGVAPSPKQPQPPVKKETKATSSGKASTSKKGLSKAAPAVKTPPSRGTKRSTRKQK